jgi:hypothetical protein
MLKKFKSCLKYKKDLRLCIFVSVCGAVEAEAAGRLATCQGQNVFCSYFINKNIFNIMRISILPYFE